MKPTALLALSIALVAGPALADSGRLVGLPAALLSGAAAEGTRHELSSPPVPVIRAGGNNFVLGETPLADVGGFFGGQTQHAADETASADWLCYAISVRGRDSLIWFVSDGTAGGPERRITLIATSLSPAKPGCGAPTGSLNGLDLPVPDLGSTEADLQSAFGIVDAVNGFVAYQNQSTPVGDEPVTIQTLNYLIADGVVTGLAASQISGK